MKINKKFVILIVAMIAAVAILFTQSAMRPATAQPATLVVSTPIAATPTRSKLSELLNIDPNVKPETSEPIYDFSHAKTIDADQAAKNDEVIAHATDLIRKGEKNYLTEGWLHTAYKTKSFKTEQRTFADGKTLIPTEWTDDEWMLLDKNGDVIKAVTIQDTGNPQLMQIGVYENGAWKNISLGTSSEPEKYHPSFGVNELTAQSDYKDITKLTAETSAVNGQNAVAFRVEQAMKTVKNEGADQADGQIYAYVTKYYYATNSGMPLQIESYEVNSQGLAEITQRILTNMIEKVSTPPDHILAYFTK